MSNLYIVTALYKKLQTNIVDITVENDEVAGVFKVYKSRKYAQNFVEKIKIAQGIETKIIVLNGETGEVVLENEK